jgi:hypothetical protein
LGWNKSPQNVLLPESIFSGIVSTTCATRLAPKGEQDLLLLLSAIYNFAGGACHKNFQLGLKDILQPTGEYSPSLAFDSTHPGADIFLLTPSGK